MKRDSFTPMDYQYPFGPKVNWFWYFTDDEISPLFEQAYNLDNIVLPESW